MPDPKMPMRLLESLTGIIDVINFRRLDYESRMDRILKIILNYLGVKHGSIMALDKKKYLLVKAASRPELVGCRQPLDADSVSSWVVKNQKPLFVPDILNDARFKGRASTFYQNKSLLSAPIIDAKGVAGVINATDKIDNRDFFKEDVAGLLKFSGFILSLIEQQQMHEEIKKQRNVLRKRNKELRRQEAMRAELSRLLVHDLKGPLSEVVANLDILSFSVARENKEFLEAAQMGCEQAVSMVSNLVSIDTMKDGKMRLIKENVDPASLLREALSAVKGLAGMKNVALLLEADTDKSLPFIKLDRVLILRVLQNLLVNGLRHSASGASITVGCRRLPGACRLEFYVRDQGEGIPPDKQKVIFEKYASLSGKQDGLVGTGLGLYFSRLAVEEHRGTIGLESARGEGSRFFFSLPF